MKANPATTSNTTPCTDQDFHQVFVRDEIGQHILAHLIAVYENGELFDKDPLVMAYNVGKRDIVRDITFRSLAGSEKNRETQTKEKEARVVKQKKASGQLTSSQLQRLAREEGLELEGDLNDE